MKTSYLNDIQKCRVAWQYVINNLGKGRFNIQDITRPKTLLSLKKSIDDMIIKNYEQDRFEDIDAEISNVVDTMSITEEELNWVSEDEKRACYFCYQQLINSTFVNEPIFTIYPPSTYINKGLLNDYLSSLYYPPLQSKDGLEGKLEYINEFVGCLLLHKQDKIVFINTIKNNYFNSKEIESFSWAKDNESMYRWLYNYMSKNLLNSKVFYNTDLYIQDYFSSAIEIFDMWQGAIEQKQLYLIKLKKAYQQKVYRTSKAEKERTYTYSMSPEIKDRMDDISRWTGVSKNRIIEDLIWDKYKEEYSIEQKKTKKIL